MHEGKNKIFKLRSASYLFKRSSYLSIFAPVYKQRGVETEGLVFTNMDSTSGSMDRMMASWNSTNSMLCISVP